MPQAVELLLGASALEHTASEQGLAGDGDGDGDAPVRSEHGCVCVGVTHDVTKRGNTSWQGCGRSKAS